MAEKVGFIGVGIMGRPMVKNLVEAGYPVTVFDIVPAVLEALEALESEGVPAAVSSSVRSVRIAEEGKQRRVRVLDAPVSGGEIPSLSVSVTGPVILAEDGISVYSGVE